MNANDLWMQGEAASDREEWAAAESWYRRALAAAPRHVPSLIGLSTVYSRQGAHRDAHAAALAAFDARPQHPALVYAIAQRLRFFHEFARLEACLDTAGFADRAPVAVGVRAAVMLSSIGAHERAVRMVESALLRAPGDAAANYVRGNLHLFSGQTSAAEASYEHALDADPRMYQAAWMLAAARTQTAERNHVPRLRRQVEDARPGGEGEAYACFGLHKELHDLQDWHPAWEALERGCRAKRANASYSLADDQRMIEQMARTCTEEFISDGSGIVQAAVPIFIVGMHRSGTTLLERILSGHSQVGDAGETSAFDACMQLATNHALPGRYDEALARRAANADFDDVARRYAEHARWLSRGQPFFTEKLPTNFLNAGFIAKALPQARILHLVRDPMDTCFSNLRTLFAGVATYSYVQDELAGFYGLYRRLMEHWREVLPAGRFMDVAYADLVSDPERTATEVLRFCGLPAQSGLSDVQKGSGRIATASAVTARQGIQRDRGQQWRRYEAQLQPLVRGLGALAYSGK